MPQEDSENLKIAEKPTTSEDIIAELLNDVKTSEQVFTVDKLAGMTEADLKAPEVAKSKKHKKKHKKHHKHGKSKKKKKSSRKRSRSPSKKHRKKRRYSSSSSSSSSSTASDDKNDKNEKVSKKVKEILEAVKEEVPLDPLPKPSVSSVIDAPPPKPNIPPSKPLVNTADDDDIPLGADFRTINAAKKDPPAKLAIKITTVIPKVDIVEPEDGEIEDDDGSEKEIDEKNIVSSEWSVVEKKSSRSHNKDKEKKKRSSRKRSRSSSSVDTTELLKQKSNSSKKSTSHRNRSRSRSRSREKGSKVRKTSPISSSKIKPRGRGETRFNRRSLSRSREPKTRSRSKDKPRKRSRSNDLSSRRRRSRSRDRSREWKDRRRDYDDYRRRRSRSRDFVDKERLLAIAKKKRAEMYAKGERDNASIEDFVSYMHKLQKRQAREKRREKGEAVSEDDSDDGVVNYKHPYALPRSDPIRINIVNAATASLAQKSLMPSEEKVLDESQLRLVFPVSSGAVHKENAEWTPVIKEDSGVPKSCTDEQKKRVALTSVEIERCRQQGIPIAQKQIPTFLTSIIPPPPPPPQFLPHPDELFQPPPSPPPLPPVLYVPHKDRMIMREPMDIKLPAPNDISKTLKQRADAQKKIHTNPNDFEAHRMLREANEKVELWGALKSLPGKYTGTTGLKLLTPDELQPHNPKYHAWVKRDQFKNAAPAVSGVGMRMMEMMGWKPGEGLGRDATGNVEPLVLDVKSDRRGLIAEEEMSTKQRNKLNASNNVPVDLSNKNPISLIMELCAKRRLPAPNFYCEEIGQDHNKTFVWTLTINDVQYRPLSGSKQKKEGKTIAAIVALQSMGILPRDPNLPVVM